ncbi:MAG: hypothetical protein D6765_09810 [Bacteroidetes bacterium]|nr:MAG: hypothetical protein D6765_09810 [Bacteroidota bacterium]
MIRKKSQGLFEKARAWVAQRGFHNIRTAIDKDKQTHRLLRRNDKEPFLPDLTAQLNGRKYYFELALKSKAVRRVVSKWKLLAKMARLRGGKLYLLAPYGHRAFTERILNTHRIEAKVVSF